MAAIARNSQAFAYEELTVSTTAIGPTATVIAPSIVGAPAHGKAMEAYCSVETNAVRFRIDGVDPTASVGHPLAAGDKLTVTGYGNIKALRFIRQSADASVKITYSR